MTAPLFRCLSVLPLLAAVHGLSAGQVAGDEFVLVQGGKAVCRVLVDEANVEGKGGEILQDAAKWLADSVRASTGAVLSVDRSGPEEKSDEAADEAAVVIARADAYPEVAARAGLESGAYDAFCIVSSNRRLHILGNSEAAARHGVATLLRQLGFRYYAPSPRWHVVPSRTELRVDMKLADEPRLAHRGIWYAYAGGEAELMDNYRRWAVANRLSVASVIRTGHSYGNIISRNTEAFAAHPEYYALLPDGQRDNTRAVNARKFCFSNPGLIQLVAEDRIKLLESYREANPAAYMVSVDPSDGEGTCHCDNCRQLGTTTDRVLHLANQVAKGIRERHPDGWVGLYAYSSHRLPPTIDVEPNVYVQVAMGFNRTPYSLPELVERWSDKVGAIGLREYYGVEAWDWGLPGRMRGSRVAYHRKWIPYYAARKLNAINAETNANWGGQTLGLYVASQLMWDPAADVDALADEYFERCFGKAAEPMRRLMSKFDEAPPLRAATLTPMFLDLREAHQLDDTPEVRRRLVDLMAYLTYVAEFRRFDLVRSRRPSRDDEYYDALRRLMQYAWRIRMRDTVHYYALARRLCNGLPVQDQRMEFYMFNKERPPVWMTGEQLSDEEVRSKFDAQLTELEADGDPVVAYSRYFEPIGAPREHAGPSRQLNQPEEGLAAFRNRLTAYLVPAGRQQVKLGIAPTGRSAEVTVYLRGDTVLKQQTFRQSDEPLQTFEVELPKANEYRMTITGGARLQAPPDTPLVFEASAASPAWIDYSGPHYFYVPQGARQVIVDAGPRLSLHIPGQPKRLDITPASRVAGKDYAVIEVPEGAAGKVWRTSAQTRGQVVLLNIPPLLSLHPETLLVPREVAEADGLTTRP